MILSFFIVRFLSINIFLYLKKLRLIYKTFYWHWRRRKRKVITWHGNTSVKPVPLAARAFKRALVPCLILIFWILYPKLVSALLETRSFFIKIEMTSIYFRAFLPWFPNINFIPASSNFCSVLFFKLHFNDFSNALCCSYC